MTATATEKAAPIPALLPCPFCGSEAMECHIAEPTVQCSRCSAGVVGENETDAIATWNCRADRASQEERIREDEQGLRGKVVYPCARFRNDDEFRDPEGYVIVKAERAEASEGRPGPMYYTLVSDAGEVRTLLSTLFTRDADRARHRLSLGEPRFIAGELTTK